MAINIRESKIDPEKLRKAKEAVQHFQTGSGYYPGDFALALVRAVMLADSNNLAKFNEVFPEYVQAIIEDRRTFR